MDEWTCLCLPQVCHARQRWYSVLADAFQDIDTMRARLHTGGSGLMYVLFAGKDFTSCT